MPHLRCNTVHVSSFANTSSVAIQFEAIENVKHFNIEWHIEHIEFSCMYFMEPFVHKSL
jgi:hypothetical protein